MEAAGVVEAVAADVTTVKPGDRVAYAMCRGSYAEYAAVPAWQLVPVPDAMDRSGEIPRSGRRRPYGCAGDESRAQRVPDG